MKCPIVLLAKGGICRVVLDCLSNNDSFSVVEICDDGSLVADSLHNNVPCMRTIMEYVAACEKNDVFFNCIGNYHLMKNRFYYSSLLREKGCHSVNVIHPESFVSTTVFLGDGNLILPKTVVDTNVKIGNDCVLFSGSIIEHDSKIGNNCYLSPSVTLCGKVNVDDNVYIGPGSVVAAGVHIGRRAIIGAGSVVLKDIGEGEVVYGNPAHFIKLNDLW